MAKDLVEEMYVSKQTDYFSLERQMFKDAVTEKQLRILDIGCGTGVLGAYFRKNQVCEVYGIEINQSAFDEANRNLDMVIKGNVETIDFPFKEQFFDVVVMGDVLEHLINPVATLNKILPVLKPGGKIFITVPNVRNWKVVKGLVFSDSWDYTDWGILDYTHMRFFTKASIVRMLEKNGFNVIDAAWVIQKPSKSDILNKISFGLFEGLLASHTFLTIQK